MKISCIAVDDEPLALGLMESHIKKTTFLELKKTFDNPIDAIEYLDENPVDLLFLDIQMPDLTGLELARIIKSKCRVIFTTAYNQYALEGFEVEALDYLLKPISYSKFVTSAQRAHRYFESLQSDTDTKTTSAPIPNDKDNFLFIKAESQIKRINYDNIIYIESAGDYLKLFLKNKSTPLMCHSTMTTMEDELPHQQFMRIHRSFIVNLNTVETIENNRIIYGKERIPVSKQYKALFDDYVKTKILKK